MADLLNECIADISPGDRDFTGFQTTFCARCRNTNCVHAKWSQDKFGARVNTQMDRLFHAPQADPKNPKYAQIADFPSMLREAMRLELASQRKDWEIPEVPILDGHVVPARVATTQAVDAAVRTLAKAKGQEEPDLPDPLEAHQDEFAQEAARELQQGDYPETVLDAPPEPEPVKVSPPPPVRVPGPPPSLGNTAVPVGGRMVGGPSLPPSRSAKDPWTPPPPKGKVVAPGATIRMGEPQKEPGDG